MSPSLAAAAAASSSSSSKMTPAQARSLTAMQSCLTCHLCDKRFTEPATLMACMHSFCHSCILEYTEDNWYCPVQGCGAPVACKGGSNEAIKKNPIISAVASSLQNIEKLIESAPENWWVGERNDEGQENNADDHVEDEGDDVVDFQMIMDRENTNEINRECIDGGDIDSEDNDVPSSAKVEKGRKTMSIDQSLFHPGEALKSNPTPPEFSCSPIAVQSSQAETYDSNDQQPPPTTSHELDCNAESSDRKSTLKSSPASVHSSSNIKEKQTSASRQSEDGLCTTTKTPGPTPRRTARVSFQQLPRVILLNPSSTLSNEHTRCLRKCVNDGIISILKTQPFLDASDHVDEFDSGFDFDTEVGRHSFLALLSSNRNDNRPPASSSFYAISTERDLSFSVGEAIIVPRTFPYYVAVACGLPIVDIEFLSSASNMKRRGTMNHQRYHFPVADEKQAETKHSESDFLVLGASNYTWDAPKKARDAALHRHSLWHDEKGPHSTLESLQPGTDLLHGYSVILVGDFDQNSHSKRPVGGKRRRQMDTNIISSGYCTRGNMCLLLQLCGANVYDIDYLMASKQIKKGLTGDQIAETMSARPLGPGSDSPITLEHGLHNCLERISQHKSCNILVMVKDKSDVKVGIDFLAQLNLKSAVLPVVSCQWLLDSIGEFEAKETSAYSS